MLLHVGFVVKAYMKWAEKISTEKTGTKLVLSVREVAHSLGCSQRFVWNEIHKREMAHMRIGRRVVVTIDQLEEYIRLHSVEVSSVLSKSKQVLEARRDSDRKSLL